MSTNISISKADASFQIKRLTTKEKYVDLKASKNSNIVKNKKSGQFEIYVCLVLYFFFVFV